MRERYTVADEAIEVLQKKIAKRYKNCQKQLFPADFDELNIITEIEKLFSVLDNDTRDVLSELAFVVYEEAVEEAIEFLAEKGGDKSNTPIIPSFSFDEATSLVYRVLDEPNDVTKYSYTSEVYRKRDRLSEALRTKNELSYEWKRSASLWSSMVTQYADIVTDEAVMTAYRDCGIKYVRYISQRDVKVCGKCDELDNMVFPIDEAPEKLHWRCRCYYIPA